MSTSSPYVPPAIACAWQGKPCVSVAQFDTASLACVGGALPPQPRPRAALR
jgi:hypothetical protein